MLAHRLPHRVEIQKPARTRDLTTGGFINNWETASTGNTRLSAVPAEVLTGPGRESMAAASIQSETSARINMRWFPGLMSTWRILWDGKIYSITSIETDRTARQEYRLKCVEGVNDGE